MYPQSMFKKNIFFFSNENYLFSQTKKLLCIASHTIFLKLHFSKSHFSERPQEKYEHVTILHSISRKKCHKNFENQVSNENIMPENNFG